MPLTADVVRKENVASSDALLAASPSRRMSLPGHHPHLWILCCRLALAVTVILLAIAGSVSSVHGSAPTSGRIALQIDNVAGELGSDWPMFCGVPFARGSLADPRHARVVDEQGLPVAAQIRTMATWPGTRDVRWLGVHFQGDPDHAYALEYGPAPFMPERSQADRTFIRRQGNTYMIDTGPARFIVPEQGPLIRQAYMDHNGDGQYSEDELVLSNEIGDDLYVIDQQGREAIIGRDTSREQVRVEPGVNEIQRQGTPLQATIRREGWYVTADGEPVARHITRLHFYRNHAFVRIEHSLILTEDTDELWLRDVGIRFAHQLEPHQVVRFAPPEHGPGGVYEAQFNDDVQAISLLQDKGPFYSQMDLEKHARYTIDALTESDQPHQLATGSLAGDWIGIDDGSSAVTLTLRQLWQQFPKELHAGRDALSAKLWSSRGGRELDLRVKTMLDLWPKEWLNEEYHGTGSYGVYYKRLMASASKPESQAQGMAKTHELLLHLHRPDEKARAQRVAEAFSKPVLCLADPQQLYESEAMGPIPPRDTQRFPLAEAFMETYFDQHMQVIRSWGDYGFIDYGAGPHVWYRIPRDGPMEGRWMPYVARYSGQMDYGFHSHLWRMYARSGQRKYFDYAEETNRHRMDQGMVHWDDPNVDHSTNRGHMMGKYRGAFSTSSGLSAWGRYSVLHHQTGTDLRKLYWFYYLRDYRRAQDVADDYRRLAIKLWEEGPGGPFTGTRPFAILKNLGTLYQETGDPKVLAIGRVLIQKLVDLESPQGVTATQATRMGKYGTKIGGIERWYEATGDELARKALLRGAETYAQTSMGDIPFTYYNALPRVLNRVYRITGDPLYARILRRNMDMAVAMYYDFSTGQWRDTRGSPNVSVSSNVYPLGDMAIGMDAIVRAGDDVSPTPVVQQTGQGRPVLAVFRKPADQEVVLNVRGRYPIRPRVYTFDGEPVEGVHYEPFRETLYSLEQVEHPHFYDVRLPAGLPEGDYLLDAGIGGAPWEVTWTSAAELALYAPGGIRVGSGNTWKGRFAPGSAPEAAPLAWWFHVPPDTEEFEIYASNTTSLVAPDGTRVEYSEPRRWIRIPVTPDQAGKPWQFTAHDDTFVEVHGVPPVFTAGKGERLFLPAVNRIPVAQFGMERDYQSDAEPAVSHDEHFALGSLRGDDPGLGLVLTGTRALRMPRGEALGDGRFEYFNARQGTLELWFQPYWSSMYELQGTNAEKHLLHASPWLIRLQDKGVPRGLLHLPGTSGQLRSATGMTLERGRWAHLAWQWYEDEHGRFVIECYVDGKLDSVGHGLTISGTRAANEDWQPADPAEFVTFGRHESRGIGRSLEGVVDQLRISDVRRHTGDFLPSRDHALSPDEHTLILFDFEGDVIGTTGTGREVSAELEQ